MSMLLIIVDGRNKLKVFVLLTESQLRAAGVRFHKRDERELTDETTARI